MKILLALACSALVCVSSARGADDLSSLAEKIRADHSVPALVLAAVRGEAPLGIGVAGQRRLGAGAKVTVKDPFHIGSCTKSMTALVVAALVDRGKLKWSTTIAETFPDLAGRIREEYRAVTVEQLLSHRAGLPEDRVPDATFAKLRALNGPIRKQRRRLVEIVLRNPPAVAPGTAKVYSNAGYAIAGAMAEAASGTTWESLVRAVVFRAAKITTAGFGAPKGPWGHRVVGSKLIAIPPGPLADNPSCLGPAGSVHLSIADFARYAAFQLKAARGRAGGFKKATLERLYADPHQQGYSLGWVAGKMGELKVFGHTGSNGHFAAEIRIVPARNTATVACVNAANAAAFKALDAAGKALWERYGDG